MLVLYCEAHTDDINGRPKSNDRWTEDGINSFSSGCQIDEHISSALEDSTMKLESSSASVDSKSTVEFEIPSVSEGPTLKLETTDTETALRPAEMLWKEIALPRHDLLRLCQDFGQKHELTRSASNLTSSCKSNVNHKTRTHLLNNSSDGLESQKSKLGSVKDSVETNQEAAVVHGGAVWDIFRRQDVPKLMENLRKHKKEFRHIENHPVNSE